MSPSVLLFRMCILASVATGMFGSALDLLIPELLPRSVVATLEALPKPDVEVAVGVRLLSFLVLTITLTAASGLFTFKPWARGFAVLITALSLLISPLYGVQARSSWSLMLMDVSSTLWGIVLAISYASSLSRRFALDYSERSDDMG